MLFAYKIEFRTTPGQRKYFEKACGRRKHFWNQMLAGFGQKNSANHLLLNQFFMKVLQIEFPFYSVT